MDENRTAEGVMAATVAVLERCVPALQPSYEYPEYVQLIPKEGLVWAFGTANLRFDGDLHTNDGEYVTSVHTGILSENLGRVEPAYLAEEVLRAVVRAERNREMEELAKAGSA